MNRPAAHFDVMRKMNTRVEKLSAVLTEVLSQDFGYPVTGELFAPASSDQITRLQNHAFPDDYVEFSRHCAGISAPDIHNGYFLHPVTTVLDWADDNSCADNMLIGSTGGGDQFLLNRYGCGMMRSNAGGTDLEILFDDFSKFLDRILIDWQKFRDNSEDWSYIA